MEATQARVEQAPEGPLQPRRPQRWILWVFLGLLFLFLVTNVALESDWITSRLTQWVQLQLKQSLGGSVRLKKAHLRLFPTVVFLEEFAIPPSVEVRRVRVQISPWSLLTRSLFIRSVLLEEPSLRITEAAPLLPALPASQGGEARKEGDTPFVVVRSILVRNGRIAYEGSGPVVSAHLSVLNGSIEPDLFMRRFDVKFTAGSSGLRTPEMTFQATNLEAKGEVHPDRIEIKKLEVAFPDGTLYSSGVVGIAANPSLDLFLSASLPLKMLPLSSRLGHEVSGKASLQVQVSGSAAQPTVRGRGALSKVAIDGVSVGTLSSEIAVEENRTAFSSLSGEILSGKVGGDAEVSAGGNEYRLSLQFENIEPSPIVRLLFPGVPMREGSWGGTIRLSENGRGPASLEGAGSLQFDFGPQRAPSTVGSGSPAPAPDEVPLQRILGMVENGRGSWQLQEGVLSVESAEIHLPESTLAVSGKGSLAQVEAELALQSSDLRKLLRPFGIPLEGKGTLQAKVSGDPARPEVAGRLQLAQGRVNREPLGEASVAFRYDRASLTLSEGLLQQGKGIYRVSGTISPLPREKGGPSEMDLSITMKNVDAHRLLVFVLPDLPLSATVKGAVRVEGPFGAPRSTAKLELGQGSFFGQSFDSARLSFQTDGQAIQFSSAEVARGKGRVDGSGEIGFQGTFQGKIRSDGFPLQEIRWIQQGLPPLSGTVSGELSGKGSFSRPNIAFSLAVADARYGENEIGSGAVDGDLDQRQVLFRCHFPGVQGSGSIRLESPFPFQFTASLERFEVDPYLHVLPTGPLGKVGLTLSGGIEAEGNAQTPLDSHVRLSLSDFSANISGYSVENDGEIRLELNEEELRVSAFRLKGEETSLNISGSAKLFKEVDLYINGEAGLRLLGLLTRGVSYGQGKAYLVLKIADRWDDPKLRGGLTVHDGIVRSALLGGSVNLSELSIFFNEKQLLLESVQATFGKGTISGSGKIDVERFVPTQFGFLFEVNGLRLTPAEGFSSSLNGTLLFQGSLKSQELKGDVEVVQAMYNKRFDLKSWITEFKKKEQTLSLPTQPSIDVPFGQTTRLNVHLYGKENIWVDNNVAKIPIQLDVFLRGTLARPLLFGRVDVSRGTVRFRTNEFTINSASVDFFNPERIDPQFSFKATTQVKASATPNAITLTTYTVDLGLTGNLDRFDLSLSSTPSLSEPDILALLTVGRTTEDMQSGGRLGGEAASFVVSEFLEESVQGVTGGAIDQFQVGTYTDPTRGSTGQELTLGKRLMEDRLIVTYKTTLDPSQEQLVRMEYLLSRNVSLVGERDRIGRIGGDIKFRFEFH